MKKENEFYCDCLEAFVEIGKENNMLFKDNIVVPELLDKGEKAVLQYLKDPFFQAEFSNDPVTYYFAIMVFSLQTGMIFASTWHKDFAKLTDQFVQAVVKMGPTDLALSLRQAVFESPAKENLFYTELYGKWNEMHEPYWKLEDPRDYTFKAELAAYQLGVTMILEKLGY